MYLWDSVIYISLTSARWGVVIWAGYLIFQASACLCPDHVFTLSRTLTHTRSDVEIRSSVVSEGIPDDFDQSDTRESHIVVVQFIFTDVHWWVSTPLLHIRTYWQTPQPLNIFPHNHQSLAIWPFPGIKTLAIVRSVSDGFGIFCWTLLTTQ